MVSEIDLNPLLHLEPNSATDERFKALVFVKKIHKTMYFIKCMDGVISYDRHCLYVACRYLHEYMDSNPQENSIHLEFKAVTVEKVLSFAFTGICQMKYYGGNFNSFDFANYQQFLACLNFLKPLMYQELLQMYDDDFCRIFQKLCNTARPPCEANTLQFLRLAIRFGFPKLEACATARIVAQFPNTY
ncbi:unnamed protein product, partial [Acanthocheilonema viteae]